MQANTPESSTVCSMNSGNGNLLQQSIVTSPVNASTPLRGGALYSVKLKADIQAIGTAGGATIMMMCIFAVPLIILAILNSFLYLVFLIPEWLLFVGCYGGYYLVTHPTKAELFSDSLKVSMH